MTRAGGIDLPGEVAGLVALDEVVIHGWDLAVATGQPYQPDDATAAVVHGFLAESRKEEVPESLFGPVVDVSADAPAVRPGARARRSRPGLAPELLPARLALSSPNASSRSRTASRNPTVAARCWKA